MDERLRCVARLLDGERMTTVCEAPLAIPSRTAGMSACISR